MYNQFKEAAEGSTLTVLSPGVHKVHIESLTVEQVSTSNFTGTVADLVLSDGTLSVKERIFPFAASPNFKDFKTGVVIPDDVQLKTYLDKHKHLFSKAAGSVDAMNADAGMANSFESYIGAIAKNVTKANGGKEFKVLIVDKNGFSKYPMWKGGSAEAIEDNKLVFDAAKHGPKLKPMGMEPAAPGAEDDMPF